MSKRILFIASIEKHILRFHIPFIKWFVDLGFEVHVACNGKEKIPYCHFQHQIDFARKPFSLLHFRSFSQLNKLLAKEKFSLIHCHTAASSVITRLAARKYRKSYGLKVLYTAHGFHFFKGSPNYYWYLYYPVERFLSRYLDCLITVNREDYELAKTKFYCKDVRRIKGMGVDPKRFPSISIIQRSAFRAELGISEDHFLLVYVAEFTEIKNHVFLIRNARIIREALPDVKIVLSGRGELMKRMQKLAAELGVLDIIIFLGFRDDVSTVMYSSDLGVSFSKQEGLGLHIVECMFCGLPIIATQNRGHRETVEMGKNGFIYEQGDIYSFISYVKGVKGSPELYQSLSKYAIDSSKPFLLQVALEELCIIYSEFIKVMP